MKLLYLKHYHASRLFFFVGAGSISTSIGLTSGLEGFKYLAVILQALMMISTMQLLISNSRFINWPKARLLLVVLFLYPVLHIFISVIKDFDVKRLSDAAFLISPYYLLPVVALAIGAYLARTQFDLSEVLKQYFTFILPIAMASIAFGLFQFSASTAGSAYNIFNNVFIPVAALLFFRQSYGGYFLAYASIALMFLIVVLIGSRSYMLVCLYLLLFTVLGRLYFNKTKRVVSLIVFGIVLLPALALTSVGSFREDRDAFSGKLNAEGFVDALSNSIAEGNFDHLYYWEGNSRSQVLLDAFSDFDLMHYLSGKSVFGLYESFVQRNTIEVGWAQEAFWFGVVYVVLLFIIIFTSWRTLKSENRLDQWNLKYFFSSIIVIRFLDGWIYGMPTYDIYNLLFFLAVMSVCLKKPNSKISSQFPHSEIIGSRIAPRMHA